MEYTKEELFDQLQYEIKDQAEFYYCDKVIELTKEESAEIARMILERDNEDIQELFTMDPSIVLTEMDNEKYDWADFHNELLTVINYYKANMLQKIFLPKEDYIFGQYITTKRS